MVMCQQVLQHLHRPVESFTQSSMLGGPFCLSVQCLQVLAEALEAAYILQRRLVPPRFVCYCWKDVAWVCHMHLFTDRCVSARIPHELHN
jgi:hypothetical protein